MALMTIFSVLLCRFHIVPFKKKVDLKNFAMYEFFMTLIIKAEEVWAKKDPLNWWAVSFFAYLNDGKL
jgi:hypothetical protein